jgi:hypothetical protein
METLFILKTLGPENGGKFKNLNFGGKKPNGYALGRRALQCYGKSAAVD